MRKTLRILGAILLVVAILFIMVKSENNDFAIKVIQGKTKLNSHSTMQKFNMSLLKTRAKMGDHIAMVNLAIILMNSSDNSDKNFDQVYSLLTRAAKENDGHAQYMLGFLNRLPMNISKAANAKALKYFQESAKNGFGISKCIVNQLKSKHDESQLRSVMLTCTHNYKPSH